LKLISPGASAVSYYLFIAMLFWRIVLDIGLTATIFDVIYTFLGQVVWLFGFDSIKV